MNRKDTPTIRICAYSAYWLLEKDSFANSQEIGWTTGKGTETGDIQIFAISTDLRDVSGLTNDPRVDAIHSIWQAITPPDLQYGNSKWPIQAKFKLLVLLNNPIPKSDLIQHGLLKNRWPQGSKGKILHSDDDIEKLLEIIIRNNPKQRQEISTALRGADYRDREKELIEDDESLANEPQKIIIQKIKRYKKIVNKVKVHYGNYCQMEGCSFTFKKKDGSLYSEAHHLIPLSEGGSQKGSNIVILCANHHRMLHYADIKIGNRKKGKRQIKINGVDYSILYK